jgi:hypothetical protein
MESIKVQTSFLILGITVTDLSGLNTLTTLIDLIYKLGFPFI